MSWSEIVRYLGLATILVVLVTASLGFFKFAIKDRLKLHKYFAFAAVILALIHGGIVIYRVYFMSGFQKLLNP